MNLNPRQRHLLDAVRQWGAVTVEALADAHGVTTQTIRRDLSRLEQAGLVTRFHGGVQIPQSTTENIAYRQRQSMNAEAKLRIARRLAADVPDGCSLILNIGTTIEAVARELLRHRGLRVITNNLNVATILSENPDCEVLVTGGLLRSRDQAMIGEATIDFLRQFRVDLAISGISGIEGDGTLRDFDAREVRVSKTIIEQARSVWLAADSSKFGRAAMAEVARLEALDRLYTDRLPDSFRPALTEAGVHYIETDSPAP
jgi:DeoR family glycerol-3-phosphate regulon repressor